MIGWEFTDTHQPLRLVEKPDPVVKPGYVVVDVKACGLCHSDVSAMEHESWKKMFRVIPLYLGHELAGVISEVGEGVEGWKVGDKVGVCPMFGFDGAGPSYGRDGGYATKCLVTADRLIRIPEGLSFAKAAAATDAGQTSHHAVVDVAGIKPGMKVGILGIGGLGQFAVRIAVLKGCEVYAISRKPEARALALSLGAKDAVENVLEYKGKKLDVVVDFAGAGITTEQALRAVRIGGKVVVVGMVEDFANVSTNLMINRSLTVVGSCGGDNYNIEDCYAMMVTGELDPILTEIPFEDVGKGLELLRQGKVTGRLVSIMPEA